MNQKKQNEEKEKKTVRAKEICKKENEGDTGNKKQLKKNKKTQKEERIRREEKSRK